MVAYCRRRFISSPQFGVKRMHGAAVVQTKQVRRRPMFKKRPRGVPAVPGVVIIPTAGLRVKPAALPRGTLQTLAQTGRYLSHHRPPWHHHGQGIWQNSRLNQLGRAGISCEDKR